MKVSIQNAIFLSFLSSVAAAAASEQALNSVIIKSDKGCSSFYEHGMIGKSNDEMSLLVLNDENGLHDHLLALSKKECDAEGKMDFETESQFVLFMGHLKRNYENLMTRRLELESIRDTISAAAQDESNSLLPERAFFTFNKSAQVQKEKDQTIFNKLLGKRASDDPLENRRKMFAVRKQQNIQLRNQIKSIQEELQPLVKKSGSVEAFMNHCFINGCYRVQKEDGFVDENDQNVENVTGVASKILKPIKNVFKW